MPELPEVERFRQILLSLVVGNSGVDVDDDGSQKKSKITTNMNQKLTLKLHNPEKLPRKWVTVDEVDAYNRQNEDSNWCCTDVLRKGKLLCMVLANTNTSKTKEEKKYLFLHMGMTGRLISPTMSCSWGHKYISDNVDITNNEDDNDNDNDDDTNNTSIWPPKFTYLLLTTGLSKTVAFADPRKFGACYFSNSLGEHFDALAPDGWIETQKLQQQQMFACCETKHGLSNQRLGIKALILDQKRVVSGVGNWVADEVLYQCQIHPDQSYLSQQQALTVIQTLHQILQTAVDCLTRDIPYPETWLFGYRWTKKKAGKDYHGRNLTFLTSGGRTSAIVSSIQKLRRSQGKISPSKTTTTSKVNKVVKEQDEEKASAMKRRASDRVVKQEEMPNNNNKKQKKRKVDMISTGINHEKKLKSETKTTIIKDPQNKKRNRRQLQRKKIKEEEVEVEISTVPSSKNNTDNDSTEDDEAQLQLLLLKLKQQQHLEFSSRCLQIGFGKWNKTWLPIIELGPHHVASGPVRVEWMKRFQKNNNPPRLVYWYGSARDDLSNSFSFLNSNAIISYEKGVERGCDQLSSAIHKKLDAGKPLTGKENTLVQGLTELKEESHLPKEKRLGWLII